MTPSDQAAVAEGVISQELRAALIRCADGEISANVGLAQLVAAARDADLARSALEAMLREFLAARDTKRGDRLIALRELWDRSPRAFDIIAAVLEVEASNRVDDEELDVRHWTMVFDRVVAISPEASVAIYSLGDPALLDAASNEIVDWLKQANLLGRGRAVLEIGCGIGRLLPRLAKEVQFVVGTEISDGMAKAAITRCEGLANAAVLRMPGRDLAVFADRSFDLIVMVDAFPYVVRCGAALVEAHFRDFARLLKPGGDCLILNYSYGGDIEGDRADVDALARRHGFSVLRNGTGEFSLWDGLAFHLRRGAQE